MCIFLLFIFVAFIFFTILNLKPLINFILPIYIFNHPIEKLNDSRNDVGHFIVLDNRNICTVFVHIYLVIFKRI